MPHRCHPSTLKNFRKRKFSVLALSSLVSLLFVNVFVSIWLLFLCSLTFWWFFYHFRRLSKLMPIRKAFKLLWFAKDGMRRNSIWKSIGKGQISKTIQKTNTIETDQKESNLHYFVRRTRAEPFLDDIFHIKFRIYRCFHFWRLLWLRFAIWKG